MCFLILICSVSLFAQTNNQTLKVEDLLPPSTEDVVDEVLTNKRLRAETGSLSKFSIKTSLGYSAGSIEKPLDPLRPNLTGSNGNMMTLQSVAGSVGLKYRASAMDSLFVNTGLRMLTPFQSRYQTSDPKLQQVFDQNHQKTDLFDPSLSYTHIFKIYDAQNTFSFGQTWVTNSVDRSFGYLTSSSLSHSIAYELSRSTFGLSTALSLSFFDQSNIVINPYQTLYDLGFFPFYEFAFSDRYQLRTLLGFTFEHPRFGAATFTLVQRRVYQSLGLGISVTRNIYFYPNIQFLPEDLRSDKTNVALQTTFSLF